jgi:hypothetical protein
MQIDERASNFLPKLEPRVQVEASEEPPPCVSRMFRMFISGNHQSQQ